jgi:pyruvate-ferredoxin/flavodoxin oxidoreductase
MQTCFFAISGVLPREEAIATSSTHREDLRQEGDEVVKRNFAAVDAGTWRTCTRCRCRPPSEPRRAPAPGAAERARLRAAGDRVMLAGQGDLLPVSAFPPDGTWPTGTARGRSATSREIPVWDPQASASSATSARWSARTRRSAPRSTTASRLAGGAGPSSHVPFKGADFKGRRSTPSRSRPRTAPAAALCVEVCPAKDKSNPRHKAIDMAPQAPLREPNAPTTLLPRPARGRPRAR